MAWGRGQRQSNVVKLGRGRKGVGGKDQGGGGLANANTMAEWAATGGGRWHSALRMERK
jgi:hypothetical protein